MGRKAYEGARRRLVLAFDVGTTFSGISYSLLDPGQTPEIRAVTRFPAQDTTAGASKIPTVIYYDAQGGIRAVGAETTTDEIVNQAVEKGWVKAEWFKLHLRPMQPRSAPCPVPLPPGKRAIDVLADFLRYLRACAAQYIRETHLNGPALWASVAGEISYVFAHPNGWEGREQERMREAACLAGLVPLRERARLAFVTEGEASLHFCIRAGILTETDVKKSPGFITVDAGGGTIDLSAYRQDPDEGMGAFEEIAPAQCIFQGSVYVNVYAKQFLVGLLEGSAFEGDVDDIVKAFDKSAKIRFKTDQDPQYIKFGGTRDNDVSRNIKFGQLRLDGTDVAAFFQPAIDAIVEAVLKQQKLATQKVSHVLFVGGFSANSWLFSNVSRILREKGASMQVVRPEEHVNKAVADGAMSFFLDHFVKTRVSKAFYGTEISCLYDPKNREHRQRARSTYVHPDGRTYVRNVFSVILPRNTRVSEARTFRHPYVQQTSTKADLEQITCTILCYKGLDCDPEWIDIDTNNYFRLCFIEAELPSSIIQTKKNANVGIYYEVSYEVVLFFGLTEIKAQIAWTNSKEEEMRGPATVVYDPGSDD